MKLIKEYCLGFAFTDSLDYVYLIRKNKPAWQRGMLNGVGGKIEPTDNTTTAAMVREFEEETGTKTEPSQWQTFLIAKLMVPEPCSLYCFVTTLTDAQLSSRFKVKGKERARLYLSRILEVESIIPNLTWLIPMAKLRLTDPNWKEAGNFTLIYP